jgi:hypothetical protein
MQDWEKRVLGVVVVVALICGVGWFLARDSNQTAQSNSTSTTSSVLAQPASAQSSNIHFVLVNRDPYPIVEFGVAVSGSKANWSWPFKSAPAVAQDGTTQVPPGGQIDVTFEPTTQCVWDLGIRTMRQGSPHDVTLGGLNLCKIDHMTLLPNNQYQAKRGGQNVMGSTGKPPQEPTLEEKAENKRYQDCKVAMSYCAATGDHSMYCLQKNMAAMGRTGDRCD